MTRGETRTVNLDKVEKRQLSEGADMDLKSRQGQILKRKQILHMLIVRLLSC